MRVTQTLRRIGGFAPALRASAEADRADHPERSAAESKDEPPAAIDAAVKDTGAASVKDMGKVIGVLRGKYAGQMDMAKVSAAVKAKLGG